MIDVWPKMALDDKNVININNKFFATFFIVFLSGWLFLLFFGTGENESHKL